MIDLGSLRDAVTLVPDRPPQHLRRHPGPRAAVRFLASWARGASSLALRYPLEAVPPWRRASRDADGRLQLPDPHRDLPGDPRTVRHVHDGVGPLFHRRYWVDVADAERSPEELMDVLRADVNAGAPTALGRFEHADGRGIGPLAVGDEFLVRLPGPGRAPVRVVDVRPTSFTLVTLKGHIEAGEITFSATDTTRSDDRAILRFEIESWARSSATVLHLLYDVVPLAPELQLVMWSRMCRKVARLAGGEVVGNVRVTTERFDWPLQRELT